jgi:hypothetical protein
MKKTIVMAAVLVGFLFTTNTAQAQENALKWNFLSALVKTANFSYERAISDNSSLQLGVFYTGYSTDGTSFSGFGITPEYRYYFSGEALDGAYIAPFLRYSQFTLTEDDLNSKATLSSIGGGAVIGKQWLMGDKFTLDIFLGPTYSSSNIKVKDGSEDDFETSVFGSGFGIRTGLTFGFAF